MIEEIYAPDPKSPLWDPFNHPDGHEGVAKAFFQVGGLDPLRDEAVLYDRILRENGILTRFELYAGYVLDKLSGAGGEREVCQGYVEWCKVVVGEIEGILNLIIQHYSMLVSTYRDYLPTP